MSEGQPGATPPQGDPSQGPPEGEKPDTTAQDEESIDTTQLAEDGTHRSAEEGPPVGEEK